MQTAIEMIGELPDEEAESYFPLAELGSIQARSGDVAGAERTVEMLSSVEWRVHILGQVAEAQAKAGRRDLAQKAIRRAFDEAHRAPNQALWRLTDHAHGTPIEEEMEPMLPVLQTIATAQAKIGDLDAALKTSSDIAGSATATSTRNAAFEQVAQARARIR